MKSIAARLALWYALAATLTLAGLSGAGYLMLQKNLIHGLDLLNAAEFRQIEAHLDYGRSALGPQEIEQRIRETTTYAAVLFYIEIHDRTTGTLFRSANLRGQHIPDLPGGHMFNVSIPEVGELRACEFFVGTFDVMIATPLQPVRERMLGYVQVSIALVAVMLIVSIAIGFGLSHIALRPVFIIEEAATRIHSDNLSERIPLDDIDEELANLGRLLNQMFARLESSFEQVRRFTGEASHELKIPLSLIRLQAERMVVEGTLSPAHEEAVQLQLEEVARLNKIIDELLLISRAEAGAITLDQRAQDPHAFLESFAQDARVLAEHSGHHYRDQHEGNGLVVFDAKWIRQVLLNLVTNALNVSPIGGTVTLHSEASGRRWRVSVEDEGPGVPVEARARIFERFVRLRNTATEGSGLGLAICRSIIELHKGCIWAEPGRHGHGLRVTFEFTMNEAAHNPPAASARPARFTWDPRVIWANLRRHQNWNPD